MNIRGVANSYLVIALILGALLPVMLDLATQINIYEFLVATYALSVPASLAFVLARGKKDTLLSYLKDRRILATIAAIGLLNYAFLEFGLTYAEHFVTASLATVIYRTFPLLMLIFLPVVLRERITKYQVAALALACFGLYIALTGGTFGFLAGANLPIIVFLITIALAGALATVLVKKYAYNLESSMFIFNLANFIFFLALFLVEGMPTSALSSQNLIPIVYVGIVYNVLVGFMYYGALRILKTTFITNIYFLSPFVTFLFSSLLLGEAIEPYYLFIAALVTIGIFIQKFDSIGGTFSSKKAPGRFVIFDVTGAFVDSNQAMIRKAIEGGGRVLAVKFDSRYKTHVENVVSGKRYSGAIVEERINPRESTFVKEILGVGPGESIMINVGDTKESEQFFTEMGVAIGNAEVGKGPDFPKEQA